MPTIKQLIDKTVREGSSFSLPANKSIEFTPTGGTGADFNNRASYLAPTDGVVQMFRTNGAGQLLLENISSGNRLYLADSCPNSICVSIPLKKGDTASLIWGSTGTTVFAFFPLLGKT